MKFREKDYHNIFVKVLRIENTTKTKLQKKKMKFKKKNYQNIFDKILKI